MIIIFCFIIYLKKNASILYILFYRCVININNITQIINYKIILFKKIGKCTTIPIFTENEQHEYTFFLENLILQFG